MPLRDRLVRPERRPRDPSDEERRRDEGRRVHPVRGARPPGREEQAGRRRPDRPRDVLDRREERGCLLAVLVRDEVRERRPRRGTEEAGRDPVDGRQRDDQRRLVDERERDERPGPDEIGEDHQAPPRESVDERPERDADHDDREEVRDQKRGQPSPRPRAIEDVDGERECREVRPDGGARGGPEQEREARVPFERGQSACHSVRHAPTLPPPNRREQWPKETCGNPWFAHEPLLRGVEPASVRRALPAGKAGRQAVLRRKRESGHLVTPRVHERAGRSARSCRHPAASLAPEPGRRAHRARARRRPSRGRRRRP